MAPAAAMRSVSDIGGYWDSSLRDRFLYWLGHALDHPTFCDRLMTTGHEDLWDFIVGGNVWRQGWEAGLAEGRRRERLRRSGHAPKKRRVPK